MQWQVIVVICHCCVTVSPIMFLLCHRQWRRRQCLIFGCRNLLLKLRPSIFCCHKPSRGQYLLKAIALVYQPLYHYNVKFLIEVMTVPWKFITCWKASQFPFRAKWRAFWINHWQSLFLFPHHTTTAARNPGRPRPWQSETGCRCRGLFWLLPLSGVLAPLCPRQTPMPAPW